MPGPNWDDEDNNMHPTCEREQSRLSGQDVAFINRIKNNDTLTPVEQTELQQIWFTIAPLSDRIPPPQRVFP